MRIAAIDGPVFEGFDLGGFWAESDYAAAEYVGAPPTDALVAEVARRLGYRLPAAYVALARVQNGGEPRRRCHRTWAPTSWARDHVALTGIFAIGDGPPSSLCGEFGSAFWIEDWGYPPIGIYFADCPSAGHDMLCLNYSTCGPDGEPSVVHVDQGRDFEITFVAVSFEAFIRGLEADEVFADGDAGAGG